MNTHTAGFCKKFFQYLLVGISAMALLLAAQQGLIGNFHQGPSTAMADEENFDAVGRANPGEDLGYEPLPAQPAAPVTPAAPACPTREGWECVGPYLRWTVRDCNNNILDQSVDHPSHGSCPGVPIVEVVPEAPASAACVPAWEERNPECDWDTQQECAVQQNSCTGEYRRQCQAARPGVCGAPVAVVPAEPAAPAAPVCERKDVIGTPVDDCVGNQVCTFNIWQGPKADGSCQTGRGGAFNCRTVAGQCGAPAQDAAAPVATGICYVCDSGNWRQAGGTAMTADQCSRIDNALFNQPNKPAWCQAPQQPPAACVSNPNICSAPQPACGSVTQGVDNCGRVCTRQGSVCPAQGGITVNPTITNTFNPTNTVTVNNPAQRDQVREVVREVRVVQAAAGVSGNVGVGTTVISGQVLGVKELPKTGLPALVWSVLAFLPAGFKMRGFSRVKKDLQNHPEFIWEDRQFKFGS